MLIKRSEIPVLAVNLLYILALGSLALARLNYEFVIYCLVIAVVLGLIVRFQRRLEFEPFILWGLTLWGFLHMAGGNLYFAGVRLYDILLIPASRRYQILKYDQLVHLVGFGIATLVCFHLLRPCLRTAAQKRATLSVLVVLMGMGVGALNELLEFLVTVVVPESGVGGYLNTSLDILFNAVGAVLAAGWLNVSGKLTARSMAPAEP